MTQTFSKRIQKIMAERATKELTGGTWHKIPYSHIYLDMKYNFIDGKYPVMCDVKGSLFAGRKINYNGAAHMNSSQVVCINFFKKFFEQEKWELILIEALRKVGVPVSSDWIECAFFEYEPDVRERTNFDFYMVMEDGSRISVEIKYTESEFGRTTPDKKDPYKYVRKWTEIYHDMVNKSPFLNCSEEEFYHHYQINRNISYAAENDIVMFLTPKANNSRGLDKGRKYIDSFTDLHPNIRNVYLEELVEELMMLITDPALIDYYSKFKEKYIDILHEHSL